MRASVASKEGTQLRPDLQPLPIASKKPSRGRKKLTATEGPRSPRDAKDDSPSPNSSPWEET